MSVIVACTVDGLEDEASGWQQGVLQGCQRVRQADAGFEDGMRQEIDKKVACPAPSGGRTDRQLSQFVVEVPFPSPQPGGIEDLRS